MKKQKFFLCFLAAVTLLCATFLVACGDKNKSQTDAYVSGENYNDDNCAADIFDTSAQMRIARGGVNFSGDGATVDGQDATQEITVGNQTSRIRFGLQSGATIRFDDPVGIRFSVYASKSDFEALIEKYGADNVKLGAIVVPTDLLATPTAPTSASLTAANVPYVDIAATQIADLHDGSLRFGAVLTDLKTQNYARAFGVRGYCKIAYDGAESIAYTSFDVARNAASAKATAQTMLTDPSQQLTEAQKELCNLFKQEAEDPSVTKTIHYHLNGGAGETFGGFVIGVGLDPLPTPTYPGNDFGGWYATPACTGEAVTAVSASEQNDVTLYAKWIAKTFAVTSQNKVNDEKILTFADGGNTATFGQDYTFTAKQMGQMPITVIVTAGGEPIVLDAPDGEGKYTVSGEKIIGDLSIVVFVDHVFVTYPSQTTVIWNRDNAAYAQMNRPFTFGVVPAGGYKITSVSVSDGDTTLTVTDNKDGTYSVPVAEKTISVTVAVEEISYTLKLYCEKSNVTYTVPNGQLQSFKYSDTITLPTASSVQNLIPEHYTFQGWAKSIDGESEITDGASISSLTGTDGEIVTLFAVIEGESHTVTFGTLSGIDKTVDGNSVTAHYGDDFRLPFANVGVGYHTEYTVSNGVQVQTDAKGAYIRGEDLTVDITVSADNFIAEKSFYDDKASYDIEDVFDNNNEYHVIVVLGSDGLYFRMIAKQHSLNRQVDGFFFSLGNAQGTAYFNKSKDFHHYGMNADGTNNLCDRYVVKVSSAQSNDNGTFYNLYYEGFVAYKTFIYEDSFGYDETDFLPSLGSNAKVYGSMRILNKANLMTAADTILTQNAQPRLERVDWDPDSSASLDEYGVMVNANGRFDMDYRNHWRIEADGMHSTTDTKGVDGVISENEYAGSVVYEDTKTDRHNKMEIFAEHKNGGMKIGMRITSLLVTFARDNYLTGNQWGVNDLLRNLDFLSVFYPLKDGTASTRLLANGRYYGNFNANSGFLTAVGIDKTHAGKYETYKKDVNATATALKAENENYQYYFVTTYELFIPDSYMGHAADAEIEVMIQHRHFAPDTGWWWDAEESGTNKNTGDALSFEHCAKWTSIWQYSPGKEDTGEWSQDANYKISPTGIAEITPRTNA